MEKTAEPRALAKWGLVLVAVVTLGVAVQQYYRVDRIVHDPLGGHVNDFDRWMILTPQFIHDGADYVDDLLPTPPFSLLLLAPFTVLSRPVAQFAWVCLKLPLAWIVFAIAASMVRRSGARLNPLAIVLILACWWLPIIIDMQEGQINFVVLLPLVAALWLVQDDTPVSDAIAGTLIGLAAAIKITPLVFAIYFFWKRRWMVALAAVASLAIATFLIPSMVFGWEQNARWLQAWGNIMIVPYVTNRDVLYPASQSFGSFALRLLNPIPLFDTIENGIPYGHYMNVVMLTEKTVSHVVLGVMFVVAFAGLLWMRRPLATLRGRRYLVEIGAVTAFMLWFSERTWVHHYVSFIFTLCAAGAIVSDDTQSARTRRQVIASLALFAIISLFASEAGRIFGANGVDWAKGLGVFLWPSVVVTVVTMRSPTEARRRIESTERAPAFDYYPSTSVPSEE